MSGPPPEIEESDLLLQRAARLDMMLLEKINARALDSDDTDEIATLARAQARTARSLRQHLALLAKQKADRVKAAREAAAEPSRKTADEVAREVRADLLVEALERVISHAAAGDRERHTELVHRLERELDDWYEAPDFLDLDPPAHVRHACRVLGLPEELADTWESLPEPTFFPDPAPRRRDPDEPEFDAAPNPRPDSAEDPPVPWPNTG